LLEPCLPRPNTETSLNNQKDPFYDIINDIVTWHQSNDDNDDMSSCNASNVDTKLDQTLSDLSSMNDTSKQYEEMKNFVHSEVNGESNKNEILSLFLSAYHNSLSPSVTQKLILGIKNDPQLIEKSNFSAANVSSLFCIISINILTFFY
jgi:hypothetical protein